MLSRAVVPIHFGEPRQRVAALPGVLRGLGVADVVLLHVSSTDVSGHETRQKDIRRKLQPIADNLASNSLRVETYLSHGSPAMTITRMSAELGGNLIVFCWKAKSWLQRTLIGSTTLDVVRMSELPVLVLKHTESEGVLYATNFHPADSAVISHLNTPRLSAHPLCLLHVGERAPDPVAESTRKAESRMQLERLASECGANVEIRQAQSANVARAVVREAKRFGASTIVLGKSRAPAGLSTVLGSTAERVAYSATSSVLIIPPGTKEPLELTSAEEQVTMRQAHEA